MCYWSGYNFTLKVWDKTRDKTHNLNKINHVSNQNTNHYLIAIVCTFCTGHVNQPVDVSSVSSRMKGTMFVD